MSFSHHSDSTAEDTFVGGGKMYQLIRPPISFVNIAQSSMPVAPYNATGPRRRIMVLKYSKRILQILQRV